MRDQPQTKGQSLVEFALVLPFLLLILLGAVDLSRAFQTYVVVTNAAREGARWAGTHPTDTDGSSARAIAEASPSNVTLHQPISISCQRYSDNSAISCSGAANGDKVTVIATTDFQFASLYLFHFSSMPVSNSATMAIINGGVSP